MKNIKNFTKSVKILCGALAAATVLGGCSSASQTQTAAEPTPTQAPTVETQENTQDYVPTSGGELYLTIPNTTNLDPYTTVNNDMREFLNLIYDRPINVEADGSFSAGLIESWQVDESKTVFTFNVRQGVTFHDGTALTAQTLVSCMDRVLGYTRNVPAQTAQDDTQGEEDSEDATNTEGEDTGAPEDSNDAPVVNSNPNRYTKYNDYVSSYSATDEYTIELTMNKAGNSGLYFMTFPVMTAAGNGTGAYVYDSSTDEGIYLKANENWWKKSPYIKSVFGKFITNEDEKISLYQQSIADMVITDSQSISKIWSSSNTTVTDYLTNYYDCIVPSLYNGSLKDENVRKAISYAIDRREIISTVLLNHAEAAEMPISPDFYAYDVKYKLYEHDVDMAKSILREAGYKTSEEEEGQQITLRMIVPYEIGDEYRVDVAQNIANQLSEIGIDCQIEKLGAAEYRQKLINVDFDLAYCSYYLDQDPDVSFMLKTDASANYGHVANSELDAILDACAASCETDEVKENYAALQQYFLDKVPQIGLFFKMDCLVSENSVKGINSNVYEEYVYSGISAWSIENK